jgi:uncharacterized protein
MARRSILSRMLSFLGLLASGLLLLVLALYLFQRRLIYYPSTGSASELTAAAGRRGLEPWLDPSGEIVGWRERGGRPEARARMLALHGNAGYALHRTYYVEALQRLSGGADWEVILLEYPGYGARPGRPSEAALTQAGADAIDLLLAEDNRPLYLLGESIGSGPASALAGAGHPIAGLLLVTPFTSLPEVAARHYPGLPTRLMLLDRYDNEAALARFAGPVVLVVAGRDEIMPAGMGERLAAAAAGRKLLLEQPQADHNTLDLDPHAAWWEEASRFLLESAR